VAQCVGWAVPTIRVGGKTQAYLILYCRLALCSEHYPVLVNTASAGIPTNPNERRYLFLHRGNVSAPADSMLPKQLRSNARGLRECGRQTSLPDRRLGHPSGSHARRVDATGRRQRLLHQMGHSQEGADEASEVASGYRFSLNQFQGAPP